MKIKFVTRNVLVTTMTLCLFVLLVVYKLNSYYKNEKTKIVVGQISQQNSNLKSAVSTQLNQLKNTLSGYMYQIDEAKMNWVQLDSINVLAQTQLMKNGQLAVKNLFTKSGTRSERWNKDFLQKALNIKKFSNKSIHIELFQTKSGDKYIAMTFLQAAPQAGEIVDAVTVVAEANYFQKAFDLNRSRKVTHILLTSSNTVAGHSEAEYIATETSDHKINKDKYFFENEELRSANLKIISYSTITSVVSFLNIPFVLLGLIMGFACLLLGILLFAFRPIDKTIQAQKDSDRQKLYKSALDENLEATMQTASSLVLQEKSKQVLGDLDQSSQRIEKVPSNNVMPAALQPSQAPAPSVQEVTLPTHFSFQDSMSDIHNLVTLNSILEEIIFHMQHSLSLEGVKLVLDLKAEMKFELDLVRFKKLFQNILKNAIESVKDMEVKTIQIRSYDQGSKSYVEIQDSGSGVTADDLEKIWQPYYSTKEKSMHQGLGLPEAKSIANRFGGELYLSRVPSGGAMVQLVMNGNNMENAENAKVTENVSEASTDLDLDRLLDLDSDSEVEAAQPMINLEKEFTTTQFKVDSRVTILEDPVIHFKPTEKAIDQFKVQIRGPQKS